MGNRERFTLRIDIAAVVVEPEPAGDGWQCHVEGNRGHWSRGDVPDEAVGSLIRRLAVEADGPNSRMTVRELLGDAIKALMVDEDGRGKLIGWVPVFWSGDPGSGTPAPDRFVAAAQAKEALRAAGRLP